MSQNSSPLEETQNTWADRAGPKEEEREPQNWDEELVDWNEQDDMDVGKYPKELRQLLQLPIRSLDIATARISEEDAIRLCGQAILSGEMSRRTFDRLQQTPGTHMPPDTFDTKFKVDSILKKYTGHIANLLDCCINGCQAFYGRKSKDLQCAICDEARYDQVSPSEDFPLPFYS